MSYAFGGRRRRISYTELTFISEKGREEGGQSSVPQSDKCPPLSRTVVRTPFGRLSGWNMGKTDGERAYTDTSEEGGKGLAVSIGW